MKLSTILIAVLACAQLTCAKTINVADHGIVPGKDATLPLARLLDGLKMKAPAFDLHYCDNVVIEGNTYKGFDSPATVGISTDTGKVTVDPKQGFKVDKQK